MIRELGTAVVGVGAARTVHHAYNKFKVDYSRARSRAALSRGETTWQYPTQPHNYVYQSLNGKSGPLAEFNDQFKSLKYKFYEDDIEMTNYNRNFHKYYKDAKEEGCTVKLSADGVQKGFAPLDNVGISEIDENMLKTGLENGVFVIMKGDNPYEELPPKAPACLNDPEYMHFNKQRQMAQVADKMRAPKHKLIGLKQYELIRQTLNKWTKTGYHEKLREDVEMIEHGINPDIVKFNEKFGGKLDIKMSGCKRLQNNQNLNPDVTDQIGREDEAMAMIQALDSPDLIKKRRTDLNSNMDRLLEDSADKSFSASGQKEENVPEQIESNTGRQANAGKNFGNMTKDEMVNAMVQKVCQFVIDYMNDPEGTIDRFMSKYANTLNSIYQNADNPYNESLTKIVEHPQNSAVKTIGQNIQEGQSSNYYKGFDKLNQEKDAHLEQYRHYFDNNYEQGFTEDKAIRIPDRKRDISIVDRNNREVFNIEQVHDMDTTDMRALVELIDNGDLKMSVNNTELQPLPASDLVKEQNPDSESRRIQCMKPLIDEFYKMDPSERQSYMNKTEYDPDEIDKAYNYSLKKVDAYRKGMDPLDVAREQLGLNVESEKTTLEQKAELYLNAQKDHYDSYAKIFEHANQTGLPVRFCYYDNKEGKLQSITMDKEFADISNTDKMAIYNLIDSDRILAYVGDKNVAPRSDLYTNPNNYAEGGSFDTSGIGMPVARFKAEAERIKINKLQEEMQKKEDTKPFEKEIDYRKKIMRAYNSAGTEKDKDGINKTSLESAKHLGWSNQVTRDHSLPKFEAILRNDPKYLEEFRRMEKEFLDQFQDKESNKKSEQLQKKILDSSDSKDYRTKLFAIPDGLMTNCDNREIDQYVM